VTAATSRPLWPVPHRDPHGPIVGSTKVVNHYFVEATMIRRLASTGTEHDRPIPPRLRVDGERSDSFAVDSHAGAGGNRASTCLLITEIRADSFGLVGDTIEQQAPTEIAREGLLIGRSANDDVNRAGGRC
jgi:hypothetical protein